MWGALTVSKNWSAGGGGRPRSAGAKNGSGEVRVTWKASAHSIFLVRWSCLPCRSARYYNLCSWRRRGYGHLGQLCGRTCPTCSQLGDLSHVFQNNFTVDHVSWYWNRTRPSFAAAGLLFLTAQTRGESPQWWQKKIEEIAKSPYPPNISWSILVHLSIIWWWSSP